MSGTRSLTASEKEAIEVISNLQKLTMAPKRTWDAIHFGRVEKRLRDERDDWFFSGLDKEIREWTAEFFWEEEDVGQVAVLVVLHAPSAVWAGDYKRDAWKPAQITIRESGAGLLSPIAVFRGCRLCDRFMKIAKGETFLLHRL